MPEILVPKAGFVAKRLTNQQPALLALKSNVGIINDICEDYPRFEKFVLIIWNTLVGLVTLAVTLAFTTSTISDAGGGVAQTAGATATNWQTYVFVVVVPMVLTRAVRRIKK